MIWPKRTEEAQGGTELALRKSFALGLAVGVPCSAFGRFCFLQLDPRANIIAFRGCERHLGGFRCLPRGRLRSLGLCTSSLEGFRRRGHCLCDCGCRSFGSLGRPQRQGGNAGGVMCCDGIPFCRAPSREQIARRSVLFGSFRHRRFLPHLAYVFNALGIC